MVFDDKALRQHFLNSTNVLNVVKECGKMTVKMVFDDKALRQHFLNSTNVLNVVKECGKMTVILATHQHHLLMKICSDAFRWLIYSLRNGRRCMNIHWVMFHNFSWKFACLSKIYLTHYVLKK